MCAPLLVCAGTQAAIFSVLLSVARAGDTAIRLSIGGARNQEELAQALRQIAALLEENRRRASRAIARSFK